MDHIDYSTGTVRARTSQGDILESDKVIVTVPLTVLQRNLLTFTPDLPEVKVNAIHSLGAGLVEKVLSLVFPVSLSIITLIKRRN